MDRKRPFVAWVLAALLFAPLAAAETVDLRAVAGLPRAGLSGGRAIAWRNVGVVAESEWLDAELTVATCLPMTTAPLTPSDPPGSACAGPVDGFAPASPGHGFAFAFKVPRWSGDAPLVDLALRGWRAPPGGGTAGERGDGAVAELVVTQPLGSVDTFVGISTQAMRAGAGARGRAAFAGVTWQAAPATRLEFVAERGEEAASVGIDRTITLRILHAVPARGARAAAWATRALDDRVDAWRVGAGIEIAY